MASNDFNELTERMLTLEIQFKAELDDSKDFRDSMVSSIREVNAAIVDLKLQREKQMSFIGGISAVISVIVGIGAFVIEKYF